MYFCLDHDTQEVVNDDGDRFTTKQFKAILDNINHIPIDMTLSCQRLVSFNFDWNELESFYDNGGGNMFRR